MLFEIRNTVPEVSNDWVEARDLFLKGQVRASLDSVKQRRGSGSMAHENDYLLSIEIARACSMHKTSMALVRLALKKFPNAPLIQLYHARSLLTQSRQTEGIEYVHDCWNSLVRTDSCALNRSYWGTSLANMYASAGFGKSCDYWLNSVKNLKEYESSPLNLYTRSCAHESLQQWDLAIETAERCVQAAPDWSRARGYLSHCLLARGRVEEAQRQIEECVRRGHEEALVDVSAAMLPMSMGKFEDAKPKLAKLLSDWPHADFIHWVRRTLCVLLVELGEYSEARSVANGDEEKMALPSIPESGGGRHCYLPLPLVSQNRNQCVPTSVAMAIHPQGGRYDPHVMFGEMNGREGTSLWRMRQWCESHGYQVVPIQLKKDAVISMLDHQVPLIGTLEGPFSSHVDVVCGFNEDLDTLYVRDPSHWSPAAWPWEIALKRYQMHAGLLAVIDQRREEVLSLARNWQSKDCTALIDLSHAVAHADREASEHAYEQISDDSPAASLRDSHAVNVAITPSHYNDRMKKISRDPSANVVARFRAVMSLGFEDSEEVLQELFQKDDADVFRAGVRRYLQLMQQINEGDWNRSLKTVDRLLRRGCGVAQLWEWRSDILAELGQHVESEKALDRAIELEPLRTSTRDKAISRKADKITFQEYTDEVEALHEEDSSNQSLLHSLASVRLEGPSGSAYEYAAKEAIRWFPRFPGAYINLLHWYNVQERPDLSDQLLEEAQRLMPDVFKKSEEDQSKLEREPQANGDKESPKQIAHSNSQESSSEELPQDKSELLNLVWNPAHPLREKALVKSKELQQSGQLLWHETARLVACRLLLADQRDGELADPTTVLPSDPPGAAHWFADSVCDQITDYEPGIKTSLAVDKWLQSTVPNYQEYSELWFKRVLLLEHAHQMEAALEELRKLLDRYPGSATAHYRMGVVKFRQYDYPAACEHLEQSLRVNPGLAGAMIVLRDVYETLDEMEKAFECTKMLRKKLPYSADYLRDEILTLASSQSVAEAEKRLEECESKFPKKRIRILQARLHLVEERTQDAANVVSDIAFRSEDDDGTFKDLLAVKLHVAQSRNNAQEILSICDQGLERWPDATRLKEIKAEQLAVSDPKQSQQYLQELLYEGEPTLRTAWQFLSTAPTSPDRTAKDLVKNAPQDRQQELAVLLAEVMGNAELLRFNEKYLKWSLKKFPESDSIRYFLASHYNQSGQNRLALKAAKQLHQRNPDSPEAARMYGRCLMDLNPKDALKVLEKVCRQNRSTDYLFDLARCYLLAGNQIRSREIHWEILQQNPYVAASWTNLFLLNSDLPELWNLLTPILLHGRGADDEYFCVAAVELALKQKAVLHTSWFPIAVDRWMVLQTHPGFNNERPRLEKALLAWMTKRPQDLRPEMNCPQGFVKKLGAKYRWPKLDWIPNA